MTSRKILILTNRIPWPLHDGGALGMDFKIRGYQQAGMQVYLLAMNTTRHFVPDEKLAKLYRDLAGFEAIPVNNDLQPHKILSNLFFSREPEHVSRFYAKDFADKIVEVISRFKPDVIQFESPFLASYLPVIRAHSKAVLLLRVNNVEYQIWERLAAESKGLKKPYLKNLSRRIRRYEEQTWKEYDLLLPVTEEDAHILQRHVPANKIVLAPFGINMNQQLPTESGHFLATYHVGAMDWMPNTDAVDWMLTDIWPGVRKAVPEATFHFAGRYTPDRFFQHLPDGAFCYGEVPDVLEFIADKGTLLVPLRAGGGIRVKILEAMATGKLVISTTIGMQGIKATEGVHFLKADTPEEYITALQWLRANEEQAKTMTAAALKLVHKEYSMEIIIRRITDALTTRA
jgi:glycosyltransferase involved in cell wall biosynthesis